MSVRIERKIEVFPIEKPEFSPQCRHAPHYSFMPLDDCLICFRGYIATFLAIVLTSASSLVTK